MSDDPHGAAESRLDPLIHPTNRLRICAALASASRVEFSAMQRIVGLSPSALSKQVHTLIDAGYVHQSRATPDSRRVWLRLTPKGARAYRSHLAALQAIIDGGGASGPADDADHAHRGSGPATA